jgi:hypothetical protein
VWENLKVELWYAQNTILHVSSKRLAADEAMRAAREKNAVFPLCVIHPHPAEERLSPAVGWRKRREAQEAGGATKTRARSRTLQWTAAAHPGTLKDLFAVSYPLTRQRRAT